ncbi:nickel-dependent hydrogenase large subunit [Nitratiruptor tergarcus]|uniref:Ni,Fe-hydrogenase I large subunit n=1 Tax=Nitratiruptor tergarcus DSM 16512 TaxID=1069081 RepID=A0A1W1WUC0_9BACT|nr:nickel-dependent hydrogenase large subunit [Nitratiruptor tergarcus]SMC09795.1 Ni,Fe-hydrogenase I large subunit [Nitratiruptor tergarcus DSM 16512]
MKIEILQKVEGEVYLHYKWNETIIEDVEIEFLHYRGIEKILLGKDPLDALVINPRICGICGHAHLRATVEALENAFGIIPTQKAKTIREITTFCEILQNHLKWFYLVIAPFLLDNVRFFAIQPAIVNINKIIALFGGQYPHNSYMLPGGVTCDPTTIEIFKAKNYLAQAKDTIKMQLFKNCTDLKDILKEKSDFGNILRKLITYSTVGQSYDRFVVLGENSLIKPAKILKTSVKPISVKFIKETDISVTYRGRFYETGPLARMLLLRYPLIMQLHRRFKDALVTRVAARVVEIDVIMKILEQLLDSILLSEPSCIDNKQKDGYGMGVVEAARGSLIHRVWVENGTIAKYQIITPTQWNLLQGTKEYPGVARKAIQGLKDTKTAELIFRSFDICSVCTTH